MGSLRGNRRHMKYLLRQVDSYPCYLAHVVRSVVFSRPLVATGLDAASAACRYPLHQPSPDPLLG